MISSALRALLILEQVGHSPEPIGVTDIARNLGVAPGTVFRGLDALESAGYVERFQSSARFTLGPVVNSLRQSLLSRFELRDLSLPYLRQLAFATGETVSITMRVGWYGLRLAAAQGVTDVTSSSPIGEVRKLDRSCAGRAILAHMTEEQLSSYLAWVLKANPADESTTLLRDVIRDSRERGFAIEIESHAPDRAGAAFALRGRMGPIAAITIEGPVLHVDRAGYHSQLNKWTSIVKLLQKAIDSRSGFYDGPFAHLDPSSMELAAND